jgi:[ribosomal protein S18]-alanine N-acetyltransferase
VNDLASRAILQLRDMAFADIAQVMEIERACFSMAWRETTFESLLRRTDTDLVVAIAEGALVGYAIAWTIVDQAELGNVAVKVDARGKGVGRTLVEATLDRVRRRGAEECFLEVRESNILAQGLYQKCGFEMVGRRRKYYASPIEDALVMRVGL